MYQRINRYLAKNNVIDLPLEIGGDNKKITILFDKWSSHYKVLEVLDNQNVATQNIEIGRTLFYSNTHLKYVIKLVLEKVQV